MKPSSSLSLKSLASSLNPPLLITPRDSEKLRVLLTKSFRQQLDNEHSSHSSTGKTRPTDAHIERILSSPLLRKPSAYNADQDGYAGDSAIGRAQSLLVEPMMYFQNQVAAGKASLDTATICLQEHNKNRIRFESDNSRNISSPVLGWLWSSGLEESLWFASNKEFTKELIPCLINEGEDARVWRWFDRLSAGEGQPYNFKAMKNLLMSLTWTRISQYNDMAGALESFLKAAKKVESLDKIARQKVLRVVGTKIIQRLAQNPTKDLDPKLCDRFESSLDLWEPVGHRPISAMVLGLSGPNPNAESALNLIQRTNARPTFLLDICLRTAELLNEQGEALKAKQAVQFIRRHFNNELDRVAPRLKELGLIGEVALG